MAPAPPDPAVTLLLQDIANGEGVLTCSEVRRLPAVVGEDGKPKDVSWTHKQRLRGTKGADGKFHRLPMVIGLGGKFVTTRSAIVRWLRAINNMPLTGGPSPAEQREPTGARSGRWHLKASDRGGRRWCPPRWRA